MKALIVLSLFLTSWKAFSQQLVGAWPHASGYDYFGTSGLDHTKQGNYALLQHRVGGTTYLNSPDKINFRISNQDKMVLTQSGRIGIGTLNPERPLHVVGNQILSTGPGAGFQFRDRGTSDNSGDWVWYSVQNIARLWRANVGDLLTINTSGNVGIGTSAPSSKLAVKGLITTEEIKVQNVTGADFVFEESYQLSPLQEVADHIQQHQHLPEIPSATEMQKEGVKLGEMNMMLLQKIEELTLYLIEQDSTIKSQRHSILQLQQRIDALETNNQPK